MSTVDARPPYLDAVNCEPNAPGPDALVPSMHNNKIRFIPNALLLNLTKCMDMPLAACFLQPLNPALPHTI